MTAPPFLQSASELLVRVDSDGTTFVGVVEDLQLDEGAWVVVDFPTTHAPNLPVGGETPLVFSGASLPERVGVTARVTFRSRNHLRQRHKLQLGDEAKQALKPVLNRRRALRIAPSPDSPVAVVVRPASDDAKRVEGTPVCLNDISLVGLSILVSADHESDLCDFWDLDLQVHLPQEAEALELHGHVRARRLTDEGVVYGIGFDGTTTADLGKKLEQIRAYVMRRQGEMLREARIIRELD